MRIALLLNYAPDGQQSMLRFGGMLERGFRERDITVDLWRPERSRLVTALARRRSGSGLRKWLGYVDKYLLFPRQLKLLCGRSPAPDVVHVVDHSNAVYVPRGVSRVPWVVTCHDLLAVRGARGEDTDCPASALGRRLQRSVVRGLGRAAAVVCDSTSTREDLERLVVAGSAQVRRVVLLGLNHAYHKISGDEAYARLRPVAGVPWAKPFLLHVGSNLPRKNKSGVLRIFARLSERWPGVLVFCGAELAPELRAQAAAAGVGDRVFAVPALDDRQLEAAYNLAHALVFPSRCEGFGWPVIEAQACGCPVVCSDRTSLPEVGGEGALVHALADEAGMADSVWSLGEPGFRAGVVARGHANLARFSTERMIDAYLAVDEAVLAAARSR